ncbi:MAG: SDR family oxidoreductase [Oscillospiraceae bacterium]|jgi:NAD(P)-dependent dehydrogenase (short-subunit alcohol dehydrogenase family)|nr:SDR family oxidoreductase [Oscillospiraceae bacterium]
MAAVTSSILNIVPIDLEYCGLKRDSLKGEVAVVTGSASNVGLGYARAIAWAGAKVVVADFNAEAGAEAARVINEENGADTAIFVKCDVTLESDVKNLSAQAFAKFGKVDLLINNAMNMRLNGKILESPVSDLEQSYAISARGVAMAIKEFVPAMVERGHGVVTYSATQFHYMPPMVGGTIYTAGKAAATSLVMSLANEVKGTGVYVFCLTPAGVGRFDPSRMPPPPPAKEGEPPRKAPDFAMFGMPGFNGMIPPESGGAAMVYSILNAERIHGSGIIMSDAFLAMDYPFPNKDTAPKLDPNARRLTDMDLTMAFCTMGPGFVGFNN